MISILTSKAREESLGCNDRGTLKRVKFNRLEGYKKVHLLDVVFSGDWG